MKTTLLLLCMAMLGTISAQSPTKKLPTEERAHKETQKLAKELGLDKKQQDKVYEANLEYERELEKLDKTKLTKVEKQAKKEVLRQKQLNHLKTVLKPEQYEKVAAKLAGKPKGKGNAHPKGVKHEDGKGKKK